MKGKTDGEWAREEDFRGVRALVVRGGIFRTSQVEVHADAAAKDSFVATGLQSATEMVGQECAERGAGRRYF